MRMLAAFAAICVALHAQQETRRPNIVVVLCDDLGYGDVSCYQEDSLIRTPVIDRLAREGVRFTDAHSADAVCTPSRYALLTGRYCWRTWLRKSCWRAERTMSVSRWRNRT